jgi:hypothetical protein
MRIACCGHRGKRGSPPASCGNGLSTSAEQRSSERLRVGPEGESEADLWRINELICRVRKKLLLASESGLNVPYSTLTRWIREAQLRDPPRRSGEYHQAPGEEMQHDTSPHRVMLSGKAVTAQCAGLTFAYSRRLFFQYYPRFTRFEAKHFLLEAVCFNDGSCPLCIIDNTSVIVVAGTGPEAVISPEMVAFARALGFGFCAHHLGHADRKGRIEKPSPG